ncbi:uncharacterized protein LOC114803949 [Zeugodacus cucurbitae]|uniref:uncharacterized protein LOC114803949 n=1 Tax=Zeugodacus cucurbitae TaxID=28588 RepID=UPI0023D8FA05|nr:uncharacterized protein LOC114803949 [Zeugodacus cucurbitae]
MGRSSSKLLETPNNPLQELQFEERKREQRKRKQEKQQKQIAKLQKKQAKKTKRKSKLGQDAEKQTSITTKLASGVTKRTNSLNSQSTSYEINKEEFNRQIEQQIQNHLDSDLCTFVMNQVSLTLQFFGNYENELANISEELLAKENELNQNLEEHSILLSTPLDAAVSKWLQYKPIHGPEKHNPQPLQPLAMYVIFENIDIARPNDANYDSISPLCKVDLDTDFYNTTPCKEDYMEMLRETKWKGYVRLKLREEPKTQRIGATDGDVYTDGSSGYSTTSVYSLKAPITASSNRAESEYDYTYIAHLNTHHPLAELKMHSQRGNYKLNAKVLPDSCVSTLAQFVEPLNDVDTDDDDDDEDETEPESDDEDSADEGYNGLQRRRYEKTRYRDEETVEAIRLYKLEQERRQVLLQQCFLNSKEFMRYFGELVRQQLAERLQIYPEELDEGTYRGSSIYTKYFELIPAIYVAHNAQHWPDCAFQFRIRERPISTNPLTGQQFQWPTRSMIRRIETFGFHVIPIGYAPKRQRNPFRELEWRIVFPKAERYLEQHLTNTQVKVFMMTKALVKTFVEPQEKHKALSFIMEHLRMHLFWECERNFTAWPEEYLGEVLLRFISTFMQRLREKCLKDFFIEERNLFESIPEYSLVMLFSILADIVANPLMHLMVALKNLDFAEDFFPKLNFKRIFENLSENNMLKLKIQAKNSRSLVGLDAVEDEPLLMPDEDAKGLVGMKQHRDKTKGKLRRKTHVMRHNIEMKKKQELERRRLSEESIDVEFFFRRNLKNSQLKQLNQGVENLRRTNILEIIIDHLIAMTEKAMQFRVLYLAKTFLAQARRLCKFYNNYGCDMGAREYLHTIDSIEEEIAGLQLNEDFTHLPPTLPIRTSVEASNKSKLTKEVFDHLESVRRTVKVDIEVTRSEREKSPITNNSIAKFVEESARPPCSFNENLEFVDNVTPNLGRRKSIKFTEHVVEVHEGDTNPIQKPEGQSLVGILRFNPDVTEICDTVTVAQRDESNVTYERYDTVDNCNLKEDVETIVSAEEINKSQVEEENEPTTDSPLHTTVKTPSDDRILGGLSKKVGMLRNLPLGNSQVIKDITTSTEKLLVSVASEEKRSQLKDVIRRKTVQLKGAFNQSSES